MSNTTRKHVWPVSLVIGVAVIAIVAMMVAFAALPGSTAAQAPPPPPAPTGTDSEPAGAPPPPPPAPPATQEPEPEPNQAPMAIDGADMLSMMEGTTRSLGVDELFEDPDEGDMVSITDAYVSSGSVTVDSRPGRVTIESGDRLGESMVTVMAADEDGETASITITVTVEDDSPAVEPPTIIVMPDSIESSSTSGGSSVKLTLTIGDPGALNAGSSVVLYLEDDFQVGDIDMSKVYFVGNDKTGRVYVTDSVVVDDDDHFGGDDDWDLRIYVPDMNPGNDTTALTPGRPRMPRTSAWSWTRPA